MGLLVAVLMRLAEVAIVCMVAGLLGGNRSGGHDYGEAVADRVANCPWFRRIAGGVEYECQKGKAGLIFSI